MQFEAIKLRFLAPLHLGRGREELDKSELIYHSDSLKSAIYAVGISHFEEWQDAGRFFNGFRISSCFPYAADEFFLPRPKLPAKIEFKGVDVNESAKRAKNILFLSWKVFQEFVAQENGTINASEENITSDHTFLCENPQTCRLTEENGNRRNISFISREVQQRVKVAREGKQKDSIPFYIDRIRFHDACGLYFLVQFTDEKLKPQVLTALKILGENGIGTDRTVGNGIFEFDEINGISNLEYMASNNTNRHIPLGLFLPQEKEYKGIDLGQSTWTLLKRGGYMGGSEVENLIHLRKKSIYMFGEGSVFYSRDTLEGKFVDLKPDWDQPLHPVWRCGMPVIIKI
jgi:CRISPR-associated protein Csm4